MVEVGQKYILHSENGLDYDIEIININLFRPQNEIYAIDLYDCNGTYAGDVIFVGDEFINKCELVKE